MASGTPLATGRVASLARPGGNVTGLTSLTVDLSPKRLELARDLVPGASRFAILGRGAGAIIQETEVAARALGVSLEAVGIRSPAELDGAFSTIARQRRAVLLWAPDAILFRERPRVAELALKHRLPTVSSARDTPKPVA